MKAERAKYIPQKSHPFYQEKEKEKDLLRICTNILSKLVLISTSLYLFGLMYPVKGFSQITNNCQVVFEIDLTASPDAQWDSPEDVIPGDPCCGMPDYFDCFEIVVELHEDALAFEVEFKSVIGELYYIINCEGISQTMPADRKVRVCTEGTSAPVSLVFCRPGSPVLSFMVKSLPSGIDIDFAPLPSLCMDDDPLPLTGAVPAGGEYFIGNDSEPSESFDPSFYEPGDYVITYQLRDEDTGCLGLAHQIITVHPLPELSCADFSLCHDSAPVTLAAMQDQLPPGGTFIIEGTAITEFDPQHFGPGVFQAEYFYTSAETGCSAVCSFQITLHGLPEVEQNEISLCDYTGEGFVENINLTDYHSFISSADNIQFAWFYDEDMELPVTQPEIISIADEDALWVLITHTPSGCATLEEIVFHVQTMTPENQVAEVCEQSTDGALELYNVDLNSYNSLFYPSSPYVSYEWFWDEALQNPVTLPIPILSGSSHTFWISITDGECSASARLILTVHPLPEINCHPAEFMLCQHSETIDLYETFSQLPTEGFFTLNGLIVSEFTPLEPGTFSLVFTFEDAATGCASQCNITIEVVALPEAGDVSVSLCDESGTGQLDNINLTLYEPQINPNDNITFTWYFDPDLQNEVPNPESTSIEDGYIFYVKTEDPNSCFNTATVDFTVIDTHIPDKTIDLCDASDDDSQQVFDLDLDTFNNEIYPDDPGVSYTWFEDAEMTLEITDPVSVVNHLTDFWVEVSIDECVTTAKITFRVNSLPEVNCMGMIPDFCSNDAPFDLYSLEVSPPGGVFSGAGVNVQGFFNPGNAGEGTHTLTYTWTSPDTQCSNSCTFTVTVLPHPETENIEIDLCQSGGQANVDLFEYTSDITGETDVTFAFYEDAALTVPVASPENHTVSDGDIIYVEVSNEDCFSIATITFSVMDNLDLLAPTLDFCDESGTGLLQIYDTDLNNFNNSIYPVQQGVEYQWYSDAGYENEVDENVPVINHGDFWYVTVSFDGCLEESFAEFEILPVPELTCHILPDICENAEPLELTTFASPEGGTFSGAGVSENTFDPTGIEPGAHTIMYSYEEVGTCTATCELQITVLPVTPVVCPDTLYFCSAAGMQLLDASSPAGGIYQGFGVSEDNGNYYFEPNGPDTGVGEYILTYTFEKDGCTDICTFVASVQDIIDVSCEGDQFVCIDSGILVLDDLCPNPGVFSGTGVSFNADEEYWEFDPAIAGEGDHAILHIFTHPVTGLEYNCNFTVTVYPLPMMDCSGQPASFCTNEGPLTMEEVFSPLPSGGVYFINGTETELFDTTEAGDFEITYQFTDEITLCSNTCTFSITIHPLPDANDSVVEICHDENEIVINLLDYNDHINPEPDIAFAWFHNPELSDEVVNPGSALIEDGDTIYVQVTDEEGCSNIASLSFVVVNIAPVDTTIELCDASADNALQVYNIQLADYNETLYPYQPGISYQWFTDSSLGEAYEIEIADIISDGDELYFVIHYDECTFAFVILFTIHPLPEISCNDITVCDYADATDLSMLVSHEGGIFESPWVSGSIFDVDAAGPGTHAVLYTYSDSNGCVSTCELQVKVFAPEGFACPEEVLLCLNDGLTELNYAAPPGGSYSGPGVSQNEGIWYFNPLVAGTGSHMLTYTYEETEAGCIHSCTFTITVKALPGIECPADMSVCENDEDIILSQLPHFPQGGTFEGMFVSFENDQYIFNTQLAGTEFYEITYHYFDEESGCGNACSFIIKVTPLPSVVWDENLNFCSNDGILELEIAQPSGGIYSGNYVVDGQWFDFGAAGIGHHDITYTYTNTQGCTTTADTVITVNDAPVVYAGEDMFFPTCTAVSLQGAATNGTLPYAYQWRPSALLDNPQIANPQTYTLGSNTTFVLKVTDANGCQDSDVMQIWIENGQYVDLLPFEPVCQNEPPFPLEGGLPLDGMYYINDSSIPATTFDPMQEGAGEHTIYYIFSEQEGCYATAERQIIVYPLPDIQWGGEEFCAFSGLRPITQAYPEGGFFAGDYLTGSSFDTNASGTGEFPVSYNYTDTFGCSASVDAQVIVHALPHTFAGDDQVITTGNYTTIQAANPGESNYDYFWTPQVFLVSPLEQTTFTRELLFSQVFSLIITDRQTGCTDDDEMVVLVEGGELEFVYTFASPSKICDGDTTILKTLVSGGKPPYRYFWYEEDPQENPSAMHINDDTTERNFSVSPGTSQTYYLKATDFEDNNIFRNVNITVNPLPEINLPPIEPLCFNTQINLEELVEFPAGGVFFFEDDEGDWTHPPYDPYPEVNTGSLGTGTHTLVYEYTDTNGCSNFATIDFTVIDVYASFSISQPDICQPHIITIVNESVGAEGYLWDFDENPENTPEDMADILFEHIFPVSDTAMEYTVVLTMEHAQCPDTFSQTISIDPRPQPAFASPEAGCGPLTIDFQNQSTHTNDILLYFWEFGDGTSSVMENPSKTFHNHSDEDKEYIVSLTIVAQNYQCFYSYEEQVLVYPEISAGFTVTPGSSCSPATITIIDQALHAEWYFWELGDGSEILVPAAEFTSPFTHDYINTGNQPDTLLLKQTLWIERENEIQCIQEYEEELVILPEHTAVILANGEQMENEQLLEGCSPFALDLLSEETASILGRTWHFGDGTISTLQNPQHIFTNDTQEAIEFTLSLQTISQWGCQDEMQITVRVLPAVASSFSFSPHTACSPAEINFISTSTGITPLGFAWDFGNGLGSTEEHPEATFSHEEPSAVTYTIGLLVTDENGCTDTSSSQLVVHPGVTANISTEPVANENHIVEGCATLTVHFSAAQSVNAQTFLWDFDDGNSSSHQEITHTFENPGQYEVTLVTGSGGFCQDTKTITILVHGAADSRFAISSTAGCSPLEGEIEYLFTPDATVDYYWDMEGTGDFEGFDAATLPASQIWINTGEQPHSLTMAFRSITAAGCISETTRQITVYPQVSAQISTSDDYEIVPGEPLEGCSPFTVGLSAEQSEGASSFHWNFGDETTSTLQNPVHTFFSEGMAAAKEYQVVLWAESDWGCYASDSITITAQPTPTAYFETDFPEGCSPHTISFDNQSDGATHFNWNFGDGNISAETHPTHTYSLEQGEAQQTYTVTLEAIHGSGCSSFFQQEVLVLPPLSATFTANPAAGCHPFTVEFSRTENPGLENATYFWNYGDGNTSSTAETMHSHTFNHLNEEEQTFQVSLTVTYQDICNVVHEQEVVVFPQPEALFSISQQTGCAPLEIMAENLSIPGMVYTWDFGDGTEPMETDESIVNHIYYNPSDVPAIFPLTLTVLSEDECTHSITRNITVYPETSAFFTATPQEGCHPMEVTFDNQSVGAVSYLWDFGDGAQSTEEHPVHTFTNHQADQPEEYIVTLSIQSAYGCETLHSDTLVVAPSPMAGIQLSEQTGCAPFSPEITGTSQNAIAYHWDFGDGNTSDEEQPQQTWHNDTDQTLTFAMTLTVENASGCSHTTTKNITVHPQVTAGFTTEDGLLEGCSPMEVRFVNQSQGAVSYLWDFGNGQTSQAANPMQTFTNNHEFPVTYPVKLISASAAGCKDTLIRTITVYPMPTAGFSVNPKQQTYPAATIAITNHHPGQTGLYHWDFGDGNTSDTEAAEFTHTYTWDDGEYNTQSYTITQRVYNDYCQQEATATAIINSPVPLADFDGEMKGCAPHTITFNNQSLYAHTYQWDFGDGSISHHENPEYTYHQPGIRDVTLIAIGDGGRDTLTSTVEVFPTPVADFQIASNLVYVPLEPVRITNLSVDASSWYWEFGDGGTSVEFEPEYRFQEPGLYSISLTAYTHTEPVCTDTKVQENAVRAEEACMVVFPTAFAPNKTSSSGGSYIPGASNREVFYPVHKGVEEYRLEIYNRWGELIFVSEDPLVGWDGYVRGRLMEMGVYIWKVEVQCNTGRRINKAGDVTLIR